jgi:hypothetical protein
MRGLVCGGASECLLLMLMVMLLMLLPLLQVC